VKALNKKRIILLIIITIAIGLIYFLPNILIPRFYNQETGSNYSWRDMSYYSLEEPFSYGVNIRDIFDGHVGGGDPFLWEYKDMPTSWDYYPLALIIGLIFKLFHLKGLTLFFVVGDFIFPPISFIVFFFLFFRITRNFLFGVVSALIFLFFPSLFIFKQVLSADFYNNFTLIKVTDLFIGSFSGNFSRLFVPALTMIFFGAFLLFLHKIISTEGLKKRWIILSGILFGLLFYIYFYYWVFATISLGFLSVFFLFYRRDILWRIIRVFAYGLIVSIPYWIRFFVLMGNPIYDELKKRIGLFYGRVLIWPAGGYWLLLFVLIFWGIIFWKRAEIRSTFFYVLALFLTIPAVKNLQLVFGFNPQPDHWGSRVSIYIIILTASVLLFYSIRPFLIKHEKASSCVLSAMIGFLLVIALIGQFASSKNAVYGKSISFLEKDVVDSFKWIDENTKLDSVFLSDSTIMYTALPFYTHANDYLPHACLSLASNNEIFERYMEAYAIYGVSVDMLKDFIEQDFTNKNYTYDQRINLDTSFPLFCGTYQRFLKDGTDKVETSKEVVNNFIAKYKLMRPDIKILKYRADYLYYGPYEKFISNFDPGKYPELELVYSNNSVRIYKIRLVKYAK